MIDKGVVARGELGFWVCGLVLLMTVNDGAAADERGAESETLARALNRCPYKIAYETYRDENWDIFVMNADGSDPVNLTRTPGVDEMYPKGSPDGTKLAFVADEGLRRSRVRNVDVMNIDGTGRTRIARGARQPCWSPDGTVIAYLKGIPQVRTTVYTANKGLFFYDLKTGEHRQHPNTRIEKLLCTCWSPDGRWFVASALGGLGYGHAIIALEADGDKHYELCRAGDRIWQCRPDISPDGTKVAYAKEIKRPPNMIMGIEVADLDFSGSVPALRNPRWVAIVPRPTEVYHVDWSPDGRVILCSRGPREKNKMKSARYIIGIKAPGWDIWAVDADGFNRWHALTSDGRSNKEPDWIPVAAPKVAAEEHRAE